MTQGQKSHFWLGVKNGREIKWPLERSDTLSLHSQKGKKAKRVKRAKLDEEGKSF